MKAVDSVNWLQRELFTVGMQEEKAKRSCTEKKQMIQICILRISSVKLIKHSTYIIVDQALHQAPCFELIAQR